ncbi:dTDP-4-dehydrorhamnose 3,5-epimerase family protein [Pseudomonas sp. PDM10]|nr:dTDP-4-dehydrorhamnose 3,5-epimerase family protein [Pseudomonas sp. PDM10]
MPNVLIIEPKVFGDERGFFYESFNAKAFETTIGPNTQFVQDNHSCSQKGVPRGLHHQLENTQGKLVRVTTGEILDVVVDIRRRELSPPNHQRGHHRKTGCACTQRPMPVAPQGRTGRWPALLLRTNSIHLISSMSRF